MRTVPENPTWTVRIERNTEIAGAESQSICVTLEKGMVTHSCILAWQIPCTHRGSWWAPVHWSQRVKLN